MEVQCWVDYK